jgi:hypothetical protein
MKTAGDGFRIKTAVMLVWKRDSVLDFRCPKWLEADKITQGENGCTVFRSGHGRPWPSGWFAMVL